MIAFPSNADEVRPYTAACVQAAPFAFDLLRTLEKTRDLAADAARTGAKLILFPEAFISAYPRGTNFGSVIGSRTDEGREQFRQYHASSIEVPSPVVDGLALIAKQSHAHLVIGVVERDGGTLIARCCFSRPKANFSASIAS